MRFSSKLYIVMRFSPFLKTGDYYCLTISYFYALWIT